MTIKILVADDSPSILGMVASCLSDEGYEVTTARNGVEALEKVYQVNPDLIVLDVVMPEMTGYQVCRIMKHDDDTRNIPIILLTALDQQKDKFWGLKTGADTYLPKTADFVQALIPAVQKLLKEFDGRPRPADLSHRKVDASEIIAWVNNLLDKQLFESTIINEANNLTVSIQDTAQLVEGLLSLVNQLMQYDIGLFFLLGEKRNDLWLRANIEPTDAVVEQLKQKVLREMENKAPIPISAPVAVDIIRPEDTPANGEPFGLDDMQSTFAYPLYLRNSCAGLFALFDRQAGRYDSEGVRTCNLILNQGLIAIDNAILYKRTEEMATTDGLTGVCNHRHFQDLLKQELERSTRYKHNLSLIMIDIDHFKRFNDQYGHQAGDTVLKEMVTVARRQLRSADVLARYGGEEFIIVAPETSRADAVTTAEKLRKAIEENVFSVQREHGSGAVTISLGVSSFPEDTMEQADLIACADARLYVAKESGRNQVCAETPPRKDT